MSAGETEGSVQPAALGARRGGHRLHQRQEQALQQEDQARVRQVHRGNQAEPREGDGPLTTMIMDLALYITLCTKKYGGVSRASRFFFRRASKMFLSKVYMWKNIPGT